MPGPERWMAFQVRFRRHPHSTVCSILNSETAGGGTGRGPTAYGEMLGVFFFVDGMESEDLRK